MFIFIFNCSISKENDRAFAGIDIAMKMANSEMQHFPLSWQVEPESRIKPVWCYTSGLIAFSMVELWKKTGHDKYLNYAKGYADKFIDQTGNIEGYRVEEYNLDNINSGKFVPSLK